MQEILTKILAGLIERALVAVLLWAVARGIVSSDVADGAKDAIHSSATDYALYAITALLPVLIVAYKQVMNRARVMLGLMMPEGSSTEMHKDVWKVLTLSEKVKLGISKDPKPENEGEKTEQ